MEKKEDLLRELREAFDETKKRLGFEASFEDLDRAFRITDGVLSSDFISEEFSHQICARIVENYMSWYNYLNGLLVPSSNFLASQTEASLFSGKEDREMIWELIKKSMEFSTRHSLLGLRKDESEEAKFIDDALTYWVQDFSPKLEIILKKSNEAWTN